jgi:putative membrane protein
MVNEELPGWARQALGREGAERIEAAIGTAESGTSAEIVPILVRSSSTVGHVPLTCFALLLVCAFLFDLPGLIAGLLGVAYWIGLAACWLLAAGFALAVSRLHGVQRLLTPRADQIRQVDLRAELEYFELGMRRTQARTGILLFVSLMEHRAVVLADRAIDEQLTEGVWQEVIDLMIEGARRGDLAAGMIRAIERSGELVSPLFPIDAADVNELRDHLVVKD